MWRCMTRNRGSLCTRPRKNQTLTIWNCVTAQKPSRTSQQLMNSTASAAGSGLGVRLGHPALGSLGFHHVAHSVNPKPSPERKALSANSLQPKSSEREGKGLHFVYLCVQQRSYTWISISRNCQTPSSPETVLQNAVESAGIFSNVPKASSGQRRNFFPKNLSAKEFRSQSL